MSFNAISGLGDSGSYWPSFASTGIQGSSAISSSSLSISISISETSQDSSQLSPFAQVVSTLQQLQQSDPAEYAKLTEQIAKNLQSAAQSAQQSGDSTSASQLSQLANDFTQASSTGQLPNLKDLAQALDDSSASDSSNPVAATTSNSNTASSMDALVNSMKDVLQKLEKFLAQSSQTSGSTSGQSASYEATSIHLSEMSNSSSGSSSLLTEIDASSFAYHG